MISLQQFFPNYYRDSVSLMQLSSKMTTQDGVIGASAQMATATNIDLMVNAGLLQMAVEPKPNDLLIVIQATTEEQAKAAMQFAQTSLDEAKSSGDGQIAQEPPRSIEMALKNQPETNLVLIATPGEFAAAEALKALKQGLNAMMFSDNVSVEQEVMLKQYASAHGLLVMGPDCGTAIINGIPLAFANVVNTGAIGIIGASGTGVQQVSCLIDHYGQGISHAIGTGGHDLSEAVGGLTMLSGLDLLEKDPATEIIVLISKPPSESVAKKILERAKTINKPIVVNFLGASLDGNDANLSYVKTLEDAAIKAVELLTNKVTDLNLTTRIESKKNELDPLVDQLSATQTNLRGLYTGGTFCYEAQLLLQESLGCCFSNTPVKGVNQLDDIWQSQGHTIIDLGDDDFTRGKPHPMIDPSTRNERILKEAADPSTAVILLDLVLGYGAHEDPASGLVTVLEQVKANLQQENRHLIFIGFICGTDKDPQSYQQQQVALREAGVILADSNAHASSLVNYVMQKIALTHKGGK